MVFKFECGQVTSRDIQQINILDAMTYDKKYLLSFDDYKERLDQNKYIIYTAKDSCGMLIGYYSIVPLDYESYIRIRNGEVDKNVISVDNIVSEAEEVNYIYLDSIIINPNYRGFGVGKRLMNYAMNDLYNRNKEIKSIVAHVISGGGEAIAIKSGLEKKKELDAETLIYEKIIETRVMKKAQ